MKIEKNPKFADAYFVTTTDKIARLRCPYEIKYYFNKLVAYFFSYIDIYRPFMIYRLALSILDFKNLICACNLHQYNFVFV